MSNSYKVIMGGICAAKGFKAGGVYCGIKPSPTKDGNDGATPAKNDLGLILSDVLCNAAAVYTKNKFKAAPIYVTRSHMEETGGKIRAVIVNSKNANCYPVGGKDSYEKALKMCALTAGAVGAEPEQVLVSSTGVIGQPLPIERIEEGMTRLVEGLSYTGNEAAATAIMTTDTYKKEVAIEFSLGGKVCRIGGMAKGSGMAHPNMATVLGFITTDVAINSEMLQKALSENVNITFNCFSVDGDTSTNDMVIAMSSGLAGNAEIVAEGEDYDIFKEMLFTVMRDLTRMLAKDGEGATKLIECVCEKAPALDTAIAVAKSVISSNLFKCAIFGEDANWGRILCAVGYSDADFDVSDVDITISSCNGEIIVCQNSAGVDFCEVKAKEILSADEIVVTVSLNQGDYSGTAYGCDLTYDYVKINGDYRS
ncbi:MAG: bifunctional glutamate N-acetyltransferase/amino-acid acetyltransferase ArgJ [Oscillospiraceae bacterium]|nr:bifunctional glutamate N-acetyltransferase/amino-acid acetyltransferase ArgJ [Oscillospiraceae bacterium]